VTRKQGYSEGCIRSDVSKDGCTARHRNSNSLGLITLPKYRIKGVSFFIIINIL
jgi:hypothetical protein